MSWRSVSRPRDSENGLRRCRHAAIRSNCWASYFCKAADGYLVHANRRQSQPCRPNRPPKSAADCASFLSGRPRSGTTLARSAMPSWERSPRSSGGGATTGGRARRGRTPVSVSSLIVRSFHVASLESVSQCSSHSSSPETISRRRGVAPSVGGGPSVRGDVAEVLVLQRILPQALLAADVSSRLRGVLSYLRRARSGPGRPDGPS